MKVINIFLLTATALLVGCVSSSKHLIQSGSNLNGYRYVYINPLTYQSGGEDMYGIGSKFANLFTQEGLQVLAENQVRSLSTNEKGQVLWCKIQHFHTPDGMGGSYATVILDAYDVFNKRVYRGEGKYQGLSVSADLDGAVMRAFKGFSHNYSGFNRALAIDPTEEIRKKFRNWERMNITEQELRVYFDKKIDQLDPIEGIWTATEYNKYQIGIFKDPKSSTRDFVAIILTSETLYWEPQQVKIEFQKTAYQQVYTTTYYMGDHSKQGTTAKISETGLLEMTLRNPDGSPLETTFIKNYPENIVARSNRYDRGHDYPISTGSGFLLSESGLIVTNWHVVESRSNVDVYLPSIDQTLSAKVLLKDSKNDITLLQLKDFNYYEYFKQSIPYSITDSRNLKVGQETFTLGFPLSQILGRTPKLSTGIINSLYGIVDDPRLIQISNPIQPGNSGGPLFNMSGELVGIVVSSLNAKFFYETVNIIPQNVNFAIKVDYLNNLLSMLQDTTNISRRANSLRGKSLEQMVEVLSQFVVSIKTK